MARHLVTGCAGVIGSHLTEKLIETFAPNGDLFRGLVSFEEGLRRTTEWYKQQYAEVAGLIPLTPQKCASLAWFFDALRSFRGV
jgi:dTDP-D-glucose 4,6-dehydratase